MANSSQPLDRFDGSVSKGLNIEKKMIKQQILQHSKHMDTVMFHFINDNLKLDGLENRKEY